jgi:RNA polymerase subunit RPABC4/transcription elongation factor Spt4
MAFCANCGAKIEDGIKFCSGCGKAVNDVLNESVVPMINQQTAVMQAQTLTVDEKYCSYCGSIIKRAAEICPKCGVKQGIEKIPQNKSTTVFNIFTIIFTLIGFLLSVLGFIFFIFEVEFESLAMSYMLSTGVILIGIIFAFISLYRKQSRLFFSFCITLCAILVLWQVVNLFVIVPNY